MNRLRFGRAASAINWRYALGEIDLRAGGRDACPVARLPLSEESRLRHSYRSACIGSIFEARRAGM